MAMRFSWLGIRSWLSRSKYLLVTIAIMGFLIIIPYTFTHSLGRIAIGFWLALVLISISFSVYRIKIGGKIALVFIIATLVSITLNVTQQSQTLELINRILTSITLAFVTTIIFADLTTTNASKHFSSDYIWGGIATYLLIGLTFGSILHLIEIVTPGSFSATTPTDSLQFPIFVYFSFYVLTTIGGVLTPITLQAQSLVMIEPIIGTLYVAILIARLVNVVEAKKQDAHKKEPKDTPNF
ncbi:MAG: ion channel [Candidatus Bathyarchaeia archaeon]